MNEWEWLQQTRALRQPAEPPRDLWPGIAARLDTPARITARRSSRLLPWAMAAMLAAFSVLAGVIAWQQQAMPARHMAAPGTTVATAKTWKPRDPMLVGPAIELHLAQQQLARAIRQSPHNAFLKHMLAYTNAQVEHLQQLPHDAG